MGAGTGIFASAWPRWTTASVVAVEQPAAMVDTGRRVGAMDDPGVGFVRGVAESLPLKDGVADIV